MKFKWETLKEKAKTIAYNKDPVNGKPSSACYALLMVADTRDDWRTKTEDLRDAAVRIIDQWNIYEHEGLVDLFPSILPKKYHKKSWHIYREGAAGELVIEFNEWGGSND
ncbi:MAG: hypothetical protein KAS32_30950 [Candidatus Peribacteraceae bacterium]|nr:hypothetical protein [Candidatus Peribacteraceae bacterium]